ncbi:hypothetical protein OQA88_10822 [Cercophora sp. LCS_1]
METISLGPPSPYRGAGLKRDHYSTVATEIPPTTPRVTLQDGEGRTHRLARRIRRFWVPEILWCGVGLGCGAAIIAVLAQYDGNRPPEWPLGITLNTLLAFLATIAKAAFITPVTRGLGQLRWVWFTKPRRAYDFEVFDGATRGPFGSLRLLVSRRGGVLGFLAALVIATSFLVSTVTQGAIDYRTQPFPSSFETASVPRITVFDTDRFFMDGSDDNYQRILNMKQHVTAGAYTPATKNLAPDPILCSTGECQFPDMVSLGVCSDIADISHLLKTTELPPRGWPNMPGLPSNQTWSASLPAGQNLTIPTLFAFDFFLALDLAPSLAFPSLTPQTFTNIYLIYSNVLHLNDPGLLPVVEFRAVEMIWYWCAKSHSVNVTNGVTHISSVSVSSTILNDTTTALNMPLNRNFILCVFELAPAKCEDLTWGNLTLSPPPGFETHPPLVVNELASLSLSAFLSMSFWNGIKSPLNLASQTTFEIASENEGMFRSLGRRLFRVQGDLSLAFAINMYRDFSGGFVDKEEQLGVLRRVTGNIAVGVENFIRADWRAHTLTAGPVSGTVLVETTFVRVRWEWLAYLLVELGLACVFLVGVIGWTAFTRAETLGGSALATLCALDEGTRQTLGQLGDYEELRRRAQRIRMQLVGGPEGLVLKEYGDDEKGG